MKGFKRFCWLAAWGAWAWLGVGLHHELPRSPGPVVCRLPVRDVWLSFLGFVGDTDEVAFQRRLEGENPLEARYAFQIFDANTGALTRQIAYRFGSNPHLLRDVNRRHGVVFVESPSDPAEGRPDWGLYVVDLRTGAWRFLTERRVRELVVHPDRPWVMVATRAPSTDVTQQISVYDFCTGRELFAGPVTPPQPPGHLHFLPGTDRIVVPNMSRDRRNVRFDVWSLTPPARKVKTLEGRIIGQSASAGANSRIATSRHQRPARLDVFDVEEGRVIFSAGNDDLMPPGAVFHPVLSASGRAVLGGLWPAVWPVDGGPPIWTGSTHQWPQSIESNEAFMVVETWHKLWERWLPGKQFETRAFRRLDDGKLLYRVYAEQIPYPSHANAAGTLVLMEDGAVRRFPPQVNWSLLAFCQAVLALPLVLLWSILRWRRRRSPRRAGGVSPLLQT